MTIQRPIQLTVVALLILAGTLTAGEAMLWNSAPDKYPAFLSSSAPVGVNDLTAMRSACGEPLQVAPASAGMAFARCGSFWPTRSVWLVPVSQIAPALSTGLNPNYHKMMTGDGESGAPGGVAPGPGDVPKFSQPGSK